MMMDSQNLDEKINPDFNEKEVNKKVINKLNKIFGKEVKNLHKAKSLVEELNSKQKELEQRLLFATSEAPDKISKAITTAEEAIVEKEKLERHFQNLKVKVTELQYNEELNSSLEEVSPHLKIIEEAENIKAYQNWISSIEDLSSQIGSSLKSEQEGLAFTHYAKLKESGETIADSQCLHLKNYTCRMVVYWHDVLLTRLEEELQLVLKGLKWPFIMSSSSVKTDSPSKDHISKLKAIIDHLLQLDVPEVITNSSNVCLEDSNEDEEVEEKLSPSLVSSFNVSSLPIQLLLKPLEVRFLYHFSGEKATNSRRNPEWYLTQVLKWITAHESFIELHVQPTLNKTGQPKLSAKIEFMKGLLRLVVLKLYTDFPEIKDDEDLFCQTVQETLNFERELRLGLGYPQSQPTVLNVLTQAPVFNKWISIESKFALELMDEFVANPNSWESDEDGGISQCGEQLILLLQGITDRYKPLSQPGHRLQFLDLQLELLDDFRVRILQLTKSELSDPLNSNYIAILNTVHHLVNTISDWADLPFYIEMQYFREKFKTTEDQIITRVPLSPERFSDETLAFEESDSVFSNILSLYSRIKTDMLSVITQHVLIEVRARSQSYRKDKWFATPPESFSSNAPSSSSVIPEVSPSLCPFLEALVKHLLLLRNKLASELFTVLWKELASALNKFIYEEVILQNNFSEFGSSQLNHDMNKALFPIFGEFTTKPETYFPSVKDSLILLTLPRPTAFLLRDTLNQSNAGRDFYSQTSSPVKALEERGIIHLNVHEAQIILNIRTNMSSL